MYLYICVCVSVCESVCVHTAVTPWVFAPFASTPHSRTSATAVSERPWNAAQCSGKNPSEFAKLAPADLAVVTLPPRSTAPTVAGCHLVGCSVVS